MFLLSLVLPSCMVEPIRDLENKSFFFSSNMHSLQSFQLPTVFLSNHTGMDQFFAGPSPNNYDEMRNRTISPSVQVSRDSSVSSTIAYHKRIECNNVTIEDIDMNDVSPVLPNETTQEKAIWVSKVADTNNNTVTTIQQYIFHEHPNMTLAHSPNITSIHSPNMTLVHGPNITSAHGDDTVINILLPYDPNAPTKSDLWDGSFHSIFLHSSIEHLTSDTKNIKDLLNFMAKYILNKQIDPVRSNNLNDFKGIGEALWNLISSVYQFR